MLEILQAPNYVAAFRLQDEITHIDYERMIAELEARLRLHPRIAVYADLSAVEGVELDTWATAMSYCITKRKQLDRFARLAVVSDKIWPHVLTALAQRVSTIELRSFESYQHLDALAWVSSLDPDAQPPRGLRMIATTRPDTYAFVWNGKINRRDLDRVVSVLEVEMQSHISVRLLGRIEHAGGIEVNALKNTALFRAKLLGVRKIERYALVGDARWLGAYARTVSWLSGIPVRHFPLEREHEAWAWVEAQPASRSHGARGWGVTRDSMLH